MTDILPIKTRWLPADWMDEVVPTPEDDPSAFIRRSLGDQYLVMPVDNDEGDMTFYELHVSPGEIVTFYCLRTWSAIEVTVSAAGEIIVVDPIPSDATLFWAHRDPDTISSDLYDLIKEQCDIYPPTEAETFDVEPYDWSLSADFRLVVDEAGPRFERVILSSES